MQSIFSENCYERYQSKNYFSRALDGSDSILDAPLYAKLDGQSITIAKDDHRLVRKIASFFTLTHNADLYAVNQRLKALFDQVMADQGADLEKLREEIKQADTSRTLHALSKNLLSLESNFKKANRQNAHFTRIRKIINCLRKLFQLSPLSLPPFEEIDINAFLLKLKGEDKLSLEISGSQIPEAFNLENLKKLDTISFKFGSSTVWISYSKESQNYQMWVKTQYVWTYHDISNVPIQLIDKEAGSLNFTIKTKEIQTCKGYTVDMQDKGY